MVSRISHGAPRATSLRRVRPAQGRNAVAVRRSHVDRRGRDRPREGPHVHHRGRRPRAKPRHLGARRARQGRVRPVPPAIDAGAARSARSTDACGTSQLTHENSRSLKKNRKRPFTVIAGAPFIFCFSWPFHPIPIPTRRGPRPRYHSIRRTTTGENNELVAFGRSARWNPLALLTHSSSERDFGKRP